MNRHIKGSATWAALWLLAALFPFAVNAQLPDDEAQPPGEEAPAVPETVDVAPATEDEDIAARLNRILAATDWFERPAVRVDEGVVFLRGSTREERHREWAGRLAASTRDVVAVVNRISVAERSMWDLGPAWQQLRELVRATVRSSPIIGLALLLLIATWFITKWSVRGAASVLRPRVKSQLLSQVVARAMAVPIFLVGLYLVLTISGLTGLAVTVLGGTGLVGLIIGFAFRDIAENFLASILISMQRPFATGDMIEVAGHRGLVQSVNTRSTLLMTLEGNHVQIPNATIYKETITNFTANPTARFDFAIGIGYEDSVAKAQSLALAVLREHPAVVHDPEPLILVENLGSATVQLRVYFWIDIARYSHLKVRSAVIRLTKRAFQQAGISLPDEAREIVFPHGVPVRMLPEERPEAAAAAERETPAEERELAAHAAEGNLTTEAGEIGRQASHSRAPEGGENLLET